MFLLRRAAARGVQSKLIASQASRSFVSTPTLVTRSFPRIGQAWPQRRLYSEDADKLKENETSAEQESGESVTEEASEQQQKEENASSVADEGNALGVEPGDSAPEPESVTPASSTFESVKERASEAFGKASEAVSGAAAAASSNFRARRNEGNDGQPSRILYVGNLYFDLTPEKLRDAFAPYGNIVNHKIVTDSSGLSKGFGYIEFETVDEAARAIEELNQTELDGRRMAVQYHVRRTRNVERRGATNPPSKTLFIGNMSFQMSDKDLNDLFRQVKNVLDVRVAIDRRTGQPRGFAHADFTDTPSAEKAKEILENKVVYGRQLRIDFSTSTSQPRTNRSSDSE